MDYITMKFSADIRERAIKDKLIAARSPAGYIQMVLVPQVAMLLVKEDMSVDDEKAREIMFDSYAIGELLHVNEDTKLHMHKGRSEVVDEES